MRLRQHPGLAELDQLNELELEQITGSALPFQTPGFPVPRLGGEVHGRFSGPPLVGEFGGSYSGPKGGSIGGSIATDGRGWMAGLNAAVASRSGNTLFSGGAHTNGHDWGIMGSVTIRF
jgi:hypothetical protein